MKWAAGAALAGFVGVNALTARHAWVMTHFSRSGAQTPKPEEMSAAEKMATLFTGITLPRPASSINVKDLEPGFAAAAIPAPGGIRLGAWQCAAPGSADWVILFHGYAGEKSSLLPEARTFLALGYSVMLVDFRGSGESSESLTTIGWKEGEDVAAALQYAKTNLHCRKVFLYGVSMGAAAVLKAVRDCGAKPDGMIVESVFDTLRNTTRHRFEAMGVPAFPAADLLLFWGGVETGFNPFRHNPVDYAASVPCPALFLHGSGDPRARVEEARRVFDAIPGRKEFREFPTSVHASLYDTHRADWTRTVGVFLKSCSENPQVQ